MTITSLKWVSITALLSLALWRPSPSHPVLLDLLVCASAALFVLTLFFSPEIETQYARMTAPSPRNKA